MASDDDRLLTRAEVERRTGLGRSALYRAMRSGRFPEPLRVGPKSVRWPLSEVKQWISSLERSHGDGIRRTAKQGP
ncbi:MAG: AlpA family phage regulatory protein [Acidobacteria bacterium]|nr:AlpA family phage regulatory protein [Acidobacteriota bacterium]